MKRALLLLLLLVAAAAWYGDHLGYIHLPRPGGTQPVQSGRPRRGARGGSPNDAPTPVLVAPLRYEDVPVTVDTVGTAQALSTVTVRAQVDGRLTELDFKDGQDVKAGDVLARIDPATFQAQYDQAVAKKAQDEAQLGNARADLDRYTKLAQTNYGSKQQADTQKALVAQLDAQIRSDQAAADNAQAVLAYTTIRAPISGRTGIRFIDAGNIIHASDANGIVGITEVHPIAMIFTLPQQQLRAANAALARGSVRVQALDSDNKTVLDEGAVEVVDNQVDQTTGTVRVKARFPNASLQLWPGQFVNVRVYLDMLPHAVVAPAGSVQRGPNGAYVYVLKDDNTVAQTNVSVGRQDENIAVLTQGAAPPAQVVTNGFAQLTDGHAVKPAPSDAPDSSQPSQTQSQTQSPGANQAAKNPSAPRTGQRRAPRRSAAGPPP